MHYGFLITISIVIVAFILVAVFVLRKNQMLTSLTNQRNDIFDNISDLKSQINTLTTENTYLKKVKDADETIFQFIRCINVPKSPSCKSTLDDNPNSTLIPANEADVCRSRWSPYH